MSDFIDRRRTFRWSNRRARRSLRHGHPPRSPLRLARAARARRPHAHRRRHPERRDWRQRRRLRARQRGAARPLPFPDDSRLVTVHQTRADSAREPLSIADYRDLRDGNRSFEGMGAAFQWSANLTGGEAERVQGMKASASLFAMLRTPRRARPHARARGRAGDGAPRGVLTHGFWTRRFGRTRPWADRRSC